MERMIDSVSYLIIGAPLVAVYDTTRSHVSCNKGEQCSSITPSNFYQEAPRSINVRNMLSDESMEKLLAQERVAP